MFFYQNLSDSQLLEIDIMEEIEDQLDFMQEFDSMSDEDRQNIRAGN
jgi:hypothetical protein